MQTEDLFDRLLETYSHVSLENQKNLGKLEQVLAGFLENQIDFMLLKGADLLRRVYAVRGLRLMSDVDLLVREKDLPEIDRLMHESGYRLNRDGNPVYSDGDFTIDLTTEIFYTHFDQEIWDRAVIRPWNLVKIKAMSAEDLFVYHVAYAVLHRAYFLPSFCKDLKLILERENLNWPFVVEKARQWNVTVALYHGLSYFSEKDTGKRLLPDFVFEQLRPRSGIEVLYRGFLQKTVREQPIEGLSHLLLLLNSPGLDEKGRRLWRKIFPPRDFFSYRYGKNRKDDIGLRLIRPVHLLFQALGLFFCLLWILFKR